NSTRRSKTAAATNMAGRLRTARASGPACCGRGKARGRVSRAGTRYRAGDFFPAACPFTKAARSPSGPPRAAPPRRPSPHAPTRPRGLLACPRLIFPASFFPDSAPGGKNRVVARAIAAGGPGDPPPAERAVIQGKADFTALGRTLTAEPQWVNKVRRGEPI